MNLSDIFIRRPIMTTLVMTAILLFGFVAYRSLPVSDLPNVDFPTILVSVNFPGASPETMAATCATPLEKQFSTIAGLDSMTLNKWSRYHQDHTAVQPEQKHRCGGPGCPDRHCYGGGPAPAKHADTADLSEGEPGGLANPLSRHEHADFTAVDS